MRRGPSTSPATSSGRAISSGRRNGPGPTAASCWRPTSAAFSAPRASRTRAHSSSPRLPLSLGYDGSDSLLDPTRGLPPQRPDQPRDVLATAASFTYARAQIDASAYRPVSDHVVVAGRVRLGTIVGAGVFDIAPSRRFYSGGGGSVRGYGYQQLGPKDVDGDPIGGRGLAEFALEARIRLKQFGGNFGIVPFFDGGSLTDRGDAGLQELALRRRRRRPLLFELRADPHRRRSPAQPAEG